MRVACRRNSWPSPTPRWAPSIRPGISARTKLSPPQRHNAELRLERGEWVWGNFRGGHRRGLEQRRLARVWLADDPHVGHELQFEAVGALFAGLALLGDVRGLLGRRDEVGVALAAPAADGCQVFLARFRQVGYPHRLPLAVDPDLGASRDVDHDVLPLAPVHVLASPVHTPLGVESPAPAEGAQGAHLRVGPKHYAPAVTHRDLRPDRPWGRPSPAGN